ncbi:transcriptional regulator with XRE-family HTH domain [Tumebacillus sp. BK434]|uniref:tetratricopeptide repeat protein n=1 Tax=Tumebacillus sp. BK434 TaxID=2512169 RepID=UPI0010D84B72|nr:tetratricopeptide repeat protein [Tumebacillus sp. BK434]TCP55962.1 transcriptional regulator with XRE-family HTH domain [Tumebacillus sp. BK434]
MFSLGQRIRELRMKKGITQIDLAKGLCTPSMISQIESDRARPSYKILFAVAERLEVPLEKLLSDVDLNLEYVSTYKMARAMVAAKEHSSAIPLLKELLETPRTQISTMDIMFELADCYLHTGQLPEAEKLFNQVYELSILRQDHQQQALTLKNIGLVEFRRKRYQLAAYQWHKGLEEADKMEEQDVFLKASILFNLGLVHSKLGNLTEALDYYNGASGLYESVGSLYEIGHVYMGLGMSYKRLNDLEKASDYSERATAIFNGLDNVLMTVKLQVTCAVLQADKGMVEEAEAMLEQGIAKLKELGQKEEMGMAIVELAKLRLQQGDLQRAAELCRDARGWLPELHMYQGWINRIHGQIAKARNQRDEAIRRYQMAADCFKHMDAITEWDDTMYDLAELYLEADDYKRAFGITKEVRGYSRLILEERGIVL